MNVRELLQVEIWSKKTSRKILLAIAAVCGFAILGFLVWYEVEIHWLTSGERIAARAALVQIDALEDSGPMSELELNAGLEKAEASVKAAREAARTLKDNAFDISLGFYLGQVEMERREALIQKLIADRHLTRTPPGPNDAQIASLMRELKQNQRVALHKALD